MTASLCSAFEVAAGSVAGRHHRQTSRNDQDAFAWRTCEAGLSAVVCDGCSAGAHSELGARLASNLLAESLVRALGRDEPLPALIGRACGELRERLAALADAMGPAERRASLVHDHFLFCIVGAAVREADWAIFAVGDGVVSVDGCAQLLGPFPDNAPPYLGYALLSGAQAGFEPRVIESGQTETLRALVLGTDGAADVVTDGEALREWLEEDRLFANPDLLRRRLWAWDRERPLHDDATLLVLRRARREV